MRIGLVACVKSKQPTAAPARDLYDSALFSGARAAVEASCDEWFVLSAKHGLLAPDTVIEPYEQTLVGTSRHHRRTWSRQVLDQLHDHLDELAGTVFEVHAGKDYYDFGLVDGLRQAGAQVELPTRGLRLGEKLRHYQHRDHPDPQDEPAPSAPTRPATRRPRPQPPGAGGQVVPPAGRYRPLYEHLQQLDGPRWQATFAQVEQILGAPLPASARRHPAWWANSTGSHPHARAWLAVGFHITDVHPAAERVTFVRRPEH